MENIWLLCQAALYENYLRPVLVYGGEDKILNWSFAQLKEFELFAAVWDDGGAVCPAERVRRQYCGRVQPKYPSMPGDRHKVQPGVQLYSVPCDFLFFFEKVPQIRMTV